MRRENASQSVEHGLLEQMSVEKPRCALTKCLPERGIRVACAHVVRRNAEVRRSELFGLVMHDLVMYDLVM